MTLIKSLRPATFSRQLVILAVILFCHTGFCEVISTTNLSKCFEDIAQTAHGNIGIAVELLETKESFQLNGEKPFPMQSVYKLPIGMAVFHQIDEGTLKLGQLIQVTTNDFVSPMQHSPIRDAYPTGAELNVSNLLQKMVSESDGTACDVLLRLLGGPAGVEQYLSELNLTNVVVATTEKEMGRDEFAQYRNWSTPEGFIKLLRMLHEDHKLSVSSEKLLQQFLTKTSTGPHRLKGMLPPGTLVAHKTGSSRTINQLTRATNDAGIITLPDGRHLAIAVFVSDSTADESTREAVIAKISREAWDYWNQETAQR
ncbi:MAG TPA: class A beta-lactamase [Verrucomicrobiae bacterium]|jgi:beta-lactamase class A